MIKNITTIITTALECKAQEYVEPSPLVTTHITTATSLSPEMFKPVENIPTRNKPKGGLWCSPKLPEGGCVWTSWCESEDFRVPEDHWKGFEIKGNAGYSVLRITDPSEIAPNFVLSCTYTNDPRLDFEMLAKHYDCIEVTSEALAFSGYFGLFSMWDVETTLWLTDNWHVVGPVSFPATKSLYLDD